MIDLTRTIREIRGVKVEFGGEEHSGWLPSGAAQPTPTPVEIALVDFYISKEKVGYIFEYLSRNTDHRGDTWHQTLEDALEYAGTAFGIDPNWWSFPED